PAQRALAADRATMPRGDEAYERKPQTRAVRSAVTKTAKWLEQRFDLLFTEARPLVLHGNEHSPVDRAHGAGHDGAFRAILDRVADQVDHCAGKEAAVAYRQTLVLAAFCQ